MKTKLLKLFLLTITGACYCNTLSAQYNNTYTGGGGESVDVVNATSGGTAYSVMLGTSSTYPIILKKVDFFGNPPTWDYGYSFSNSQLTIRPTKLLRTSSGDFIVVGIANDNFTYNPFAAKFNNLGVFQWMYTYASNQTVLTPPFDLGGLSKRVNICEVMDDPGSPNTYMITATGTNPFSTGGAWGSDDFINVLRISSSGAVMWNNKYYPPIAFNTPNDDIRENPETIVYANPTGGTSRYFIAGVSSYLLMTGTTYYGFFMGIDNTGMIVDPYQRVALPTPRNCNAIFDNPDVVYSFTCSNGFTGGTSGSCIGLSRVNTASGLSLYQSDFYSASFASETDERGLVEDAASSKYVVACDIYDGVPSKPSSMGIMEIDKSSGTATYFNDYNYQRESHAKGIIDLVSGGTEHYVMTGTPINAGSTSAGMRLIGEDRLPGSVCGRHALLYDYANYNPLTANSTYQTYMLTNMRTSYSTSRQTLSGMNICTSPADYYRPTGVAEQGYSEDVTVYPTLLNAEREINMDIVTNHSGKIYVTLVGIDGRSLLGRTLEASNGKNHFSFDVTSLIPGSYLLVVTNSDKTLNKTTKLTKF